MPCGIAGTGFTAGGAAGRGAHGSDHPAAVRNDRNQFIYLSPVKPARMTPIQAEDGELLDLSRLQARRGGPGFAVVALSTDAGDVAGSAVFARRLGLRSLTIYQDFTGTTAEAFPFYGLPITYLLVPRGDVIGYITGATDWDSPEVERLINHCVERTPSR